jgi:hypothetical protein
MDIVVNRIQKYKKIKGSKNLFLARALNCIKVKKPVYQNKPAPFN